MIASGRELACGLCCAIGCLAFAVGTCADTQETVPAHGNEGPVSLTSYQGKPATESTIAAQRVAEKDLPMGDFADGSLMRDHADDKLIARFPEQFGPVDYSLYRYLDAEAPMTMHPSLFARGRDLYGDLGLFQIIENQVYQIRGDIAGLTLVRGERGWMFLDVGLTREFAARSWAFAQQHLPGGQSRKVSAVVYSHSHGDHFGGVKGVISERDVNSGRVEVIAPHGFMSAVLSETILAGSAGQRRGAYHFGMLLDVKPDGTEFALAGDGLKTEPGEVSLIAPTIELPAGRGDVTTMEVDGVSIQFMDIGGLEAPSATVIYLPEYRLIFNAELTTRKLHNVYALRGAKIRDALGWSKLINRILHGWGRTAEVMTGPHGPTFAGNERIREFLRVQRDMYGFLHNQSVRLMNSGVKIQDIGRQVEALVPGSLSSLWHTRGYHGTYNHNARAVVNHYIGYYDGNPASLNPLKIKPEAFKYVEYMGGADSILEKAGADFERGEYTFVATVVDKLVTADPDNWPARHLLADAYEQLGYQAEGPQFRHAYLSAAKELRVGRVLQAPFGTRGGDILKVASFADVLDILAARIDAEKAVDLTVRLNIEVGNSAEKFATELAHSNFSYAPVNSLPEADATLRITKAQLAKVAAGVSSLNDLQQAGSVFLEGDIDSVHALFDCVAPDNRAFAIVPSPGLTVR